MKEKIVQQNHLNITLSNHFYAIVELHQKIKFYREQARTFMLWRVIKAWKLFVSQQQEERKQEEEMKLKEYHMKQIYIEKERRNKLKEIRI